MNQQLRTMFLDYFNNYLTIEVFAEHNEISAAQARVLVDMGRELHEQYVINNKREG